MFDGTEVRGMGVERTVSELMPIPKELVCGRYHGPFSEVP